MVSRSSIKRFLAKHPFAIFDNKHSTCKRKQTKWNQNHSINGNKIKLKRLSKSWYLTEKVLKMQGKLKWLSDLLFERLLCVGFKALTKHLATSLTVDVDICSQYFYGRVLKPYQWTSKRQISYIDRQLGCQAQKEFKRRHFSKQIIWHILKKNYLR